MVKSLSELWSFYCKKPLEKKLPITSQAFTYFILKNLVFLSVFLLFYLYEIIIYLFEVILFDISYNACFNYDIWGHWQVHILIIIPLNTDKLVATAHNISILAWKLVKM